MTGTVLEARTPGDADGGLGDTQTSEATRKMLAVHVSASAADAIRHKFNPSDRSDVATIKDMTGTLITFMEGIRERNGGVAGREAAVAITNLQTASMWCVLAATKGL